MTQHASFSDRRFSGKSAGRSNRCRPNRRLQLCFDSKRPGNIDLSEKDRRSWEFLIDRYRPGSIPLGAAGFDLFADRCRPGLQRIRFSFCFQNFKCIRKPGWGKPCSFQLLEGPALIFDPRSGGHDKKSVFAGSGSRSAAAAGDQYQPKV